jgi:hypothetical protein
MPGESSISIQRQERTKRHITAKTKGTPDGKCVHQDSEVIGKWPSGQDMIKIKYLHVTKGWRERVLPPVFFRRGRPA